MKKETTFVYEARTLFAGRVWLHAKYLNKCAKEKLTLIVKYKEGEMHIEPEELKEKFGRPKIVEDKFQKGLTHKQYGLVWSPDQSVLKL